jgi:murein DD-endopeptidase MepM/ murein hydrolase activator NlpD
MSPVEQWHMAIRRHRRVVFLAPCLAALLLTACNFGGRPQEGMAGAGPAVGEGAPPPNGAQTPGLYRAFPGDTVYGVAQRFGVPVRMLIDTNGLKPPYRLEAGQPLHVPVRQEHVVQPGDTLFSVAQIYGVDQSSLARANNLTPPYAVKPGQHLVLPGRIEANAQGLEAPSASESTAPMAPTDGALSVEQLPPPGKSATAPPAVRPETALPGVKPSTPSTIVAPPVASAPPAIPPSPPNPAPTTTPSPPQTAVVVPEPAPRANAEFLWPVKGKIISGFGSKPGGLHNDGINIEAAPGSRVVAAENGVVAYAGNELRGFGNLLLIRHADGWVTAYAHNDKLLVKRGDRVKRGQVIAQVGSTGNVTSPQLHFEIRKGTEPVDPLKYLGSSGTGATPAASPAAPPNPG